MTEPSPDPGQPARRDARSPDMRILLGALPLLAFWIGYQWGAYPAILLSFGASVLAYFASRQHPTVGVLALGAFLVTAGAAVAGLVTGNERAYLARDSASDFLIAVIALGSIAARRPIVGVITHAMVPAARDLLPRMHATFVWATLLVAGVNLFQGLVRAYMLLGDLGVGQYLIWSRAFGWPTTFVMLIAVVWLVQRALEQEEERRQATVPVVDVA